MANAASANGTTQKVTRSVGAMPNRNEGGAEIRASNRFRQAGGSEEIPVNAGGGI